jgi:hypothetical protein
LLKPCFIAIGATIVQALTKVLESTHTALQDRMGDFVRGLFIVDVCVVALR